jgi:hypothetical protein
MIRIWGFKMIHLPRYAIVFGIMFASIIGWAENSATVVRVLDETEVEGLAGIVLLVNPGNMDDSQVFVTDVHGLVSVPHQNCRICTITALDPRGLFFGKTTEFDSRSLSITLILEVQPNIERFWTPGSIQVSVAVYGPNGELLPNQIVAVRPRVMTLDTNRDANRIYQSTTDSNGLVSAKLLPGDYTIATLIGGKPWEAPLLITASKSKCTAKKQKYIDSSPGNSHTNQLIAVHLLPPPDVNVTARQVEPTINYGVESSPATDTLVHESGHADPPKQ